MALRQKNRILIIDANSTALNNNFKFGDIAPQPQIGYILSLLEKKNYNYNFIDCRLIKDIDNLADYKSSDIVVISFNTYDYKFAFKLADKFKESILIGIGPHSSSLPHTVVYPNSPFKLVLRGECEYDLINTIENIHNRDKLKSIKGLYSNDKKISEISLINDLDKLPYPKYHSYNGSYYSILPVPFFKKANWGFVNSSRGCPNLCTFCSPMNRISYGYKYRMRSPKKIADEIEYLMSLGKNVIEMVADNFTVSHKQVLGICKEIKRRKIKIKWTAQAKADTLTKELMFKMKEAGCFCIRMGIETGSNKVIKTVKKSSKNWKNIVAGAIKWGKEAKIIINTYLILGLPNETKEDRRETIELLEKSKPDFVQVHYFKPYPGSALYNNANKEDFNEYLYHYNCSLEDFNEIKTKIYEIVYFNPKAITKHLVLFSKFYIRNPKIFLRLIRFI